MATFPQLIQSCLHRITSLAWKLKKLLMTDVSVVLTEFLFSEDEIQLVIPSTQAENLIFYDRERGIEYAPWHVSLYQATFKGDWKTAEAIINIHPEALTRGITAGGETALHIAVAAEQASFVDKLVERMTRDDLAVKNQDENTALCFAAASDNCKIAKAMVHKNEELPFIRGHGHLTPLHMAITYRREHMVSYLYKVTHFHLLSADEQIGILVVAISSDYYDIALSILRENPLLAIKRIENIKVTALHVLAQKPDAIGSRSQLRIWERCSKLCFKKYYKKALKRTLAHQIVHLLWKQVVLRLPDNDILEFVKKPTRLVLDAAEVGNAEFLIALIRSYPDLIWNVDENGKSIFHIAVENRHENVFSLIYELGAVKELIAAYFDKVSNTNMLHLAAKRASPSQLNKVSGAALQMQQELLWFEEVKKIVSPSHLEMRDKRSRLTPSELFTKQHKELLRDGEKWMKDTATSCMLVATLIATVVFAAAFTVPGGNDDKSGIPIFLKRNLFTLFLISDAAAMLSSSTSILTFLSILTSRYRARDFLLALPARLLFGLTSLFVSIVSMLVAFSATFFLLYGRTMAPIPLAIAMTAIFPVVAFIFLYFKLLVDIFLSTFWSKHFFRPRRRLYK